MSIMVLIAWVVQGAVGLVLLMGRRATRTVVLHVLPILFALGLWVGFIATGWPVLGWTVFGIFTVALAFGDVMLLQRARALEPDATGVRGYGAALRAMKQRRVPRAVTFHALFSPVVYFSALAACVVATVR